MRPIDAGRDPHHQAPAASILTTVNHHEAGGASDSTVGNADFDFDRSIVDQVNKELWVALFDGDFRLAVPCDVCGRWLTAGKSKRAHRGPRCAAKAGAE